VFGLRSLIDETGTTGRIRRRARDAEPNYCMKNNENAYARLPPGDRRHERLYGFVRCVRGVSNWNLFEQRLGSRSVSVFWRLLM
jgi:hypothetical protein